MSRHHMTANGPIPFTEAEEAAWDAKEQAWADDALERERGKKLVAVLAESDRVMTKLTAHYSQHEKLSWPKQEEQAKALAVDPEAPAAYLRGLAAARGIDVLTLRDKIIANVAAYETASAAILGWQQAREDELKATTTVEQVRSVSEVYS